MGTLSLLYNHYIAIYPSPLINAKDATNLLVILFLVSFSIPICCFPFLSSPLPFLYLLLLIHHLLLVGQAIRAKGKEWHKACFRCDKCHKDLAAEDNPGNLSISRCIIYLSLRNIDTNSLLSLPFIYLYRIDVFLKFSKPYCRTCNPPTSSSSPSPSVSPSINNNAKSGGPARFCSGCGARSTGGNFCDECGNKL